jgi:hypothetical protein
MCFRKSLLCCVLPIHQRSCPVRNQNRKRRPNFNSMFSVLVIYSGILLYLFVPSHELFFFSSICQIIFWCYSWRFELTFSNGKKWTLDSLTFFSKWMGDMRICPLWPRQGSSWLFDYTSTYYYIFTWYNCFDDDVVLLSLETSQEVLGQFQAQTGITVTNNWTPNVTHVVANTDEKGACGRTLKVLLAILAGKWVLNVNCKYSPQGQVLLLSWSHVFWPLHMFDTII